MATCRRQSSAPPGSCARCAACLDGRDNECPAYDVLGRDERPVLKDANGSWFIWCVASQSVAVAAASLEPLAGPDQRAALALVAVVAWSVGLILYAAVGIFVSLRLMTYPIRPEDLRPPYFVAMGAMAISVLLVALVARAPHQPDTDRHRSHVGHRLGDETETVIEDFARYHSSVKVQSAATCCY